MKVNRVFLWAIVISLSGFLFGFDTAVISGAEQSIQKYWSLNAFEHGFSISSALMGTIIGALLGAIPSDKFGRKNTLYIIACIYLFSSAGSALASNWYVFLVFRLLGGLAVGASSVTGPIYISEIAPTKQRGRLVALFQFNAVFGILISYLSDYLIGSIGNGSWRLMLAIQVIPSLLFLVLLKVIPESPRWLILEKGDIRKAAHILQTINPLTASDVLASIQENAKVDRADIQNNNLFSARNKIPIILAILFAIFNQVSGINAIIFYAPRIFEMTGVGKNSSLLSTVGLGLVNFIFTLVAMKFIDKVGRKTLMFIGSVGLIFTSGIVSYSFYSHYFDSQVVSFCLLIYIAFFAFSQGSVIWVFISEIFPTRVRAKGQTLGSTTHWLMATLIAFIFPYLSEKTGGGNTFLFFSVMMCLQLLFVWKLMPETKGKSLEQIEHTTLALD